MTLSPAITEDLLDWQENRQRSARHEWGVDLGLLAIYALVSAMLILLVRWAWR